MNSQRPRILLQVDYANGSHDLAAHALKETLGDLYDFVIACSEHGDDVSGQDINLAIAMFWGDAALSRYQIPRQRMVRLVGSHRWTHPYFGALNDQQFTERYLADCDHVLCLSDRLARQLSPYRTMNVFPYGIFAERFTLHAPRTGPLTVGGVGHRRDPGKGFHDILAPALQGRFDLQIADGKFSHAEMVDFYAGLDVLCIASVAEGGSCALIEGMACGLFPVACDVGWVPQVVTHGRDGLIVERTPEAFRAALAWCADHAAEVRAAGAANSARIRATWDWQALRPQLRGVLDRILAATPSGRFHLRRDAAR
jgi:glycosyltransferase involved in cell wall biosynthesis